MSKTANTTANTTTCEDNRIEELERKLSNTQTVIGTLIVWLIKELGADSVTKLIRQLEDAK